MSAIEFDLGGCIRFIAQLVLEALDVKRVALAAWEHSRYEETAQTLGQMSQYEECIGLGR